MDYIYSELDDVQSFSFDGLQTPTTTTTVNNLDSTIQVDADGLMLHLHGSSTRPGYITLSLKDRDGQVLNSDSILLDETLVDAEIENIVVDHTATPILVLKLSRNSQIRVPLGEFVSTTYVDEKVAGILEEANAYTDSAVLGKQDELVSGVNLRTVGGVSLLGPGNVDVLRDVKINEISVLNGHGEAEIQLGAGLELNSNHQICLSTAGLSETKPRQLSLLEQDEIKVFAEKNGNKTYIKASEFDYARMRVMPKDEDESSVRSGDFIFKKI